MYIKFLNTNTPIECVVVPNGNIVTLKFVDEVVVNTNGFRCYLDKKCEYDISGSSYENFNTVYKNDEETEKYNGKTVKFRAIAAYDERMPDNTFVAGRHIMTCCIDDVEYSPIVCICNNKHSIKSRDWIMVTGKINIEYCKFYQGKGPVIHIQETAMTSAPRPFGMNGASAAW